MKPPPPVPGVAQKPDWQPVLTICEIKWPDGSAVTAQHEAHWSNEAANVRWAGAIEKLDHPPQSCDACALKAYLEHQAELTKGIFNGRQDGLWPAVDNVVSK